MLDRLPAPLRRVLGTFTSFTPGQKAVTLLGVVALVVGGYFFSTWASKPTYATLFNNLSGADAAAITEKLTAEGTPYELANGGATIMVPQDKVNDLRIQMSGEGLPASADTGYSLLDKQGVTTSEFMQHVGYQRALEGELAKTIKSIDGVASATVHLVIPQKDVFSDDEQKPTASVLVASAGGNSLSGSQVQAIVHLVAASVEGLSPEQVTVAGSDGKMLTSGDGTVVSGDGDARTQQTAAFENRMNNALKAMLESVVGAGHARVTTTAELDFDSTETKTQKYVADPSTPPLSESSTTETYTGTGSGAGGVLGPDNIQVPNGSGASGPGNYSSNSSTKNNAVGMVTETRKSAPGNVRKLNVSVLLDSKVAAGMDTAQVQQMIATAAGISTTRGDSVAVTALPFDSSATEQAGKALAEAGQAEQQAQLMSYAKTGAMVLAVLFLMFLAWRASRKSKRSALTDVELTQLEEMQAALEASRGNRALEGTGSPLELGPGDAESAAREQDERDGRRRELTDMVESQPDEMANLLRGWLADKR